MSELLLQNAPRTWIRTTLGELCRRGGGEVQTGPFGSQLHASDYVPVGVPTVMPTNIGDNRILSDGIARVRVGDVERLARHCLSVGDIVYSRRGDVERRALVREAEAGWLCGTGSLRVRVGTSADSSWLSYYLGHPEVRAWIVRHAVGATMPNLNSSILSALPVVAPPTPEQQAIAEVLGALDDKIGANRCVVRNASALLDTLFAAEIADVEPTPASAALEPVLGGTPARANENYWGGEIPWASAKDVVGATDGVLIETAETISERGLKESPAKIVDCGTTLITARGTVGRLARTTLPATSFNQTCYALTPRGDLPQLLLYLAVRHALDQLSGLTHGTIFSTITKQTFDVLRLSLPPPGRRGPISASLDPIDHLVGALLRESRQLSRLRDALLPKLLSGELRVRQAEDLVGGAV